MNPKSSINSNEPLAVRMRPQKIEDFIGQEHILGQGKLLRRVIISKKVPSLIFYGPPGTGKTTLGLIIANSIEADFVYLNAAFTSTAEVKKILQEAKKKLDKTNRKTILFIDEIHRFNKLQQESLIPDTEAGGIIFIAATIYNPHYYLIPSLISRSVIAQFKPLEEKDLFYIMKQALSDKENGLGNFKITIDEQALSYIATASSGDARKSLNSLEVAALSTTPDRTGFISINISVAKESIQKHIFYDKKGDYHYDTISAFIKSVRGSAVDSALYWLAKMLTAGEDPRFIARRLVILASEDIGNANPFALTLATSCFQAVEFVGMPEANLVLAQATIYLAASPKSNSAYKAIASALADVGDEETKEVPEHIKTTSKDYKYPHNYQQGVLGGYVGQDYGVKKKYYFPLEIGEERRIKAFLDYLERQNKPKIQKN